MKKNWMIQRAFLLGICVWLLMACQQQGTDLSLPALAKVDGEPITREILDAYLAQQNITAPTPEQTGTALQNLIQLYAVSNQAKQSDVINDPEVRARLELQQRRLLFEAAAADYAGRFPTSDADLKQQYQQTVKETGRREYRLEALNFTNQQAALNAIVELQSGAQVFGSYQSESMSANARASLGWLTLASLPAEASNAIQNTRVNEVAAVPLQSANGWSVVQVAEVRSFTPPPFDQVKEGIRHDLNRKKVEAWVESVRGRAAVELENVDVTDS